jgi:hypothetical protein
MKKYFPLFILFIMVVILACRKYKEDSFISLRTTKGRLYGNWKLVSIEKNNQSYTDSIIKECFGFQFSKLDGTPYFSSCCSEYAQFSVSKSMLCSNGGCIIHVLNTHFECMEIIRLYGKDLWLEGKDNDDIGIGV